MGGYVYCAANPVRMLDVDGNETTEYDTDGKFLSDLGGDKIDFYHQEDGNVKVVNRSNGVSNIIYDGTKYINGKNLRAEKDVSAADVGISEFSQEFGPENSLFADFEEKGEGVFASLQGYLSTYGKIGRFDFVKNRLFKSKNSVAITTLSANPLSAGPDLWEQMIGEANLSWYDLGDKVLFLLIDSKSNTSLFYHFPV